MIDILLATFNGEKYIKEQLNSLFSQSYSDFKLIIRDDCSTDQTLNIIAKFAEKYPNKITVIKNDMPSGSAKNNFFELMKLSSAEYIMFCDQDDVWLENKIKITFDEMKKLENRHGKNTPILCHTDLTVVDENLNILNKSFFRMQKFNINKNNLNRAIVQNIVTGNTVMINRPLCDIAKTVNPQKIIMHDWWLYTVASAFGKISAINNTTVLYRQHKNNAVGAKKLQIRKFNDLKNSLNLTYKQAGLFLNEYHAMLSHYTVQMLENYSNMCNYNKFKKIRLIFKYGFFKHSFIRKIVHIFIC